MSSDRETTYPSSRAKCSATKTPGRTTRPRAPTFSMSTSAPTAARGTRARRVHSISPSPSTEPNYMKRIRPASWLAIPSVAAMLLAGCAGDADAPTPESPPAASQPAAPEEQAAPTETAPPADDAPPSSEPAPPATPVNEAQVQSAPVYADAAEVSSWAAARPQAKLGVAVDLKYQIDGTVAANRPVTLRVALVP